MASEPEDEGSRRAQRGILVGSIDVDRNGGIFNGHVGDLLRVLVFNIASYRGYRSLKKFLDHFTAQHNRMSMLVPDFGNHCPFSTFERRAKFAAKVLDGFCVYGGTIDKRDDRCI